MGLIQGGLIGSSKSGGGSSSSSLDLSDGLACFTSSFSGITTSSFSHNLGTEDLIVEFRDNTGNLLVPTNWQVINSNTLEVEFASPTQGAVTIVGCIESGLAPITGGVTTIEGLSGVVDLDSPNNSIVITTSGQIIQLNAIFTPASGAVLEQKCRDIDTLSGLIQSGGGGGGGVSSLNSISGVITLTSPDESININVNSQEIEITTPGSGAPSGASYILRQYDDNNHLTQARILSATSGIRIDDQGARSISGIALTLDFDGEPELNQILAWNGYRLQWVNQQEGSGVVCFATDFTPASGTDFVVYHGLDSTDFAFAVYNTSSDPREWVIPQNVTPSGSNHARIVVDSAITGRLVLVACNAGNADTSLTSTDVQCRTLTFGPSIGTDFFVYHGFGSEDFVFDLYDTDANPILYTVPNNISPSGAYYARVQLDTAMSGKLVLVACDSSGILQRSDFVNTLNGLTADVNIVAGNDGITISKGVQTIELSSLFTSASGQIVDQKNQKTTRLFTPSSGIEFILEHGLNTENFNFNLWRTNNDGDPFLLSIPDNLYASGLNHAVLELNSPMSGKVVFTG